MALGLGGQGSAAVADAVAVAVPAQAGDDGLVKVEGMTGKLEAKSLTLHEKLIAEKTAHALTLFDNIRLQRELKKVVKEKEETAWRLTVEKAKRKNSALDKQLKNDGLTVTMKGGVGNLTFLLTVSVEQAQNEVGT